MTIRLRLTIYWAGVLSLLLLSAAIAVFLLFQRQQWGRLDSALMEEADTTAASIAHGADVMQMITRLSEERDLGPERRVWVAVGALTIAAAGDQRADLPNLNKPAITRTIVDGRNDIFRYAITPFLLNGAPAYLADGVDARAVRESVSRLRTILLFVLPALLVSSISIGYWLAGRALVPLVAVASALAGIKPRDLSRRLPMAPIDDELGRLIRAINALLERVERASETERRFAADAAHELRTPLAVLRTGIEVVLHRERTAAQYERALNTALRDAAAVCALADDLLAITRLDQELSLGRELINLRGLAEEVIDAIEPLTTSKRLKIQTNLQAAASVQGNRDHLRRVMINLLDNALKFTPEEGRIGIALESHNDSVQLRITDSGPGIDLDDMPFIFERFFRGHSGRNESGKGLGLSLCREIIELHSGEISAANQPGGGTEFVVTLPSSPVGAMG
ncbi:MAG: HAMP domain-containing histidine kinase [Deltaproteobacteria bacterium]|nr:HAMP domain-containing histidine kinase [Deltaproteobacteria bacterium]